MYCVACYGSAEWKTFLLSCTSECPSTIVRRSGVPQSVVAVERAVRGNVHDEKGIIGMVKRNARIMSRGTAASLDVPHTRIWFRRNHSQQNQHLEH